LDRGSLNCSHRGGHSGNGKREFFHVEARLLDLLEKCIKPLDEELLPIFGPRLW
jgi:hypothetical protein